MKKSLLKLALGIVAFAFGANSYAQCPAITCPTNITVNNDAGVCGAVVNYTAPVGTDSCYTGSGSATFSFTGAMQTWVVPVGVTSITIDAYGAQGGFDGTVAGGLGGYATGTLSVTPGSTINIYVGGKGVDGPGSGQNCNLLGGYNGGGNTGATCCSNAGGGAGSGGGASDVRVGGITLNDRVIVGAGGGGAGDNQVGANGGGLIGSDGGTYNGVTATGGTQSAGGQAGGTYFPNHTCSPATDGSLGQGGDGDGNDGGGGGGGYYGGGGAANNGPGAGGSSYIGGVTTATTTGGLQSGDGQVVITFTGGVPSTVLTSGLGSGSTFPIGTTTETYKVTNIYGDTATCSFTITVNSTLDTSTTVVVNTITSNESATGATYQWLDCDNSYAVITGATSQNFTATANGNYAVEVTNGCVDTSACVSITSVSIAEITNSSISIYPNPTNDVINIVLENQNDIINYTLTTMEGKIVKQEEDITGSVTIDISKESKGSYLLKINNHKSVNIYKIIKE
jgi:hypothetical protein